MFRTHSRVIAAIVMFFFTWTSGGVFSIAYAAVDAAKKGKAQDQQQKKVQGPEERFAKLTGDLEETLADPKADVDTKRQRLSAGKTEMKALDVDIRKQFAETEKKLKDAKLPDAILQRHRKFVKHYDDNLAELTGNIERVEKAKNDAEAETELRKVSEHLKRVKAPSRHQKLDPNNLPHRQPKAVKREPRMKKEEFERGLKKDKHAWKNAKRVQVASAGSLAGLLVSSSINAISPTADDLAETIEVQLTPEIRAKALELGNNPVKIYEFVRNNIEFQVYYGSLKGAQQTLLEGAGNNFDQVSLLIALLRASNIAAKYAYGTVEIPIQKVMSWLGNVADPVMATTILATQGIPVKTVYEGGIIKSVQIENAWAVAWIDYIPSRGAVHKQGDTWIPLDPSFKQYTSQKGMDMYSLMGFNAEQFMQSYVSDPRDITSYQDYGKRLVDYIDANLPDANIEDVFGASTVQLSKVIVKKEYPYLMGTLPYNVVVKADQFSEIPLSKRYSINIHIDDDSYGGESGLNYTGWFNTLADKRITVSYEPATSADEALVAQYGGIILAVPPYLLNVKPVLKINGATVASGAAIGLGNDQNIIINFAGPDGDTDRVQNIITAGDYSAIILQAQNTPSATTSKNMGIFLENNFKFNLLEITVDDLLGQMLYSAGVSYFYHLGFENEVYAKTLQLENRHQPSEAMVTHGVNVNYIFGIPRTISEGGIKIDVDRNINSVFSPTQDNERIKAFMLLSGLSSSAWENRILEVFFDIPSVSAARLLKLASEKGIPIYTIDSSNLSGILPQLQVGADVKADIINAINVGKKVIVPKTNLTLNQWSGTGYIVINPDNGAAGYMISGGLAGGGSSSPAASSVRYPLPQRTQPLVEPTIFLRKAVLDLARDDYMGTPYVWGGKTENPGFDCSGFVHEVYAEATSPLIGKKLNTNAAGQYSASANSNWLQPIDNRLAGDIVWKAGMSHVGIYGGENTIVWPPNTQISYSGETVIHASGRPCKGAISCDIGVPCVNGNPACGTFRRVIESPFSLNPSRSDAFGTPADQVGRPR